MEQIDGIVVLNKPTGMNSMKAVKQVQHKLQAKKAGHLGTLDPLGTGVLLVALGKGTKLFESHLSDQKTYRAVFKFGIETDTLDSEGKITKTDNIIVNEEMVKCASQKLIGKYEQMPPAYSAKKIQGKKAYELARSGQEVPLKTKLIEIFSLDVLKQLEPNTFLFEIVCSSGTYIRSVCRDIATLLNTCATMVAIIRTQSGKYTIEQSVTIDELEKSHILSIK